MKTILGLCLLTLVCSPGAYSQAVSGFGAITGTVRDPYGDGLPDTAVVVSNSAFGFQHNMTTTDDGVFNIADLTPGDGYTLRLTHNGFSVFLLPNIRVTLGETMNFKIVLPVLPREARAQPAPTYSVADAVKFDLSVTLDAGQIDTLPTGDRRVDSLVPLPPASAEVPPGVLSFRGEGFTT